MEIEQLLPLLPWPVHDLRPVPGGYLHQTFRAESPEGPLFLKLYTGSDWPPEQVARSLTVQQHLYQTGHPVPRVVTPVIPAGESVLAVMSFLPGSRIDQPGPGAARAAGEALGRIHRELRSLPLTGGPALPDPEGVRERSLRLLAAAEARPAPDEMDNLAVEAARFRLRWLEERPVDLALYNGEVAQVVHGDYYPGNLLFTAPDVLSGIVDFDFVSVRFRGLEIARALVESALRPDGRFDPETAAAFLQGYLTQNALNLAERRSGFRIWLEYLLGSLYPLPLRYTGAPLPHGWERLARRRHELLLWLGAHLADLERLAASI
ncbi:MAG: phosphotransferase [Bacillota bacterium]